MILMLSAILFTCTQDKKLRWANLQVHWALLRTSSANLSFCQARNSSNWPGSSLLSCDKSSCPPVDCMANKLRSWDSGMTSKSVVPQKNWVRNSFNSDSECPAYLAALVIVKKEQKNWREPFIGAICFHASERAFILAQFWFWNWFHSGSDRPSQVQPIRCQWRSLLAAPEAQSKSQ